MKLITVFLTSLLLTVAWASSRIVNHIQFKQDCGGYLIRAANANTISIATTELETAVTYLEKEGLTEGYTSILYKTPDEDIGFWYGNLKASLEELKAVPEDASQLERSNILMKLRETLLDSGESGDSLTVPDGIEIYPSNSAYMLFALLGLIPLGATCLYISAKP